MFRSVNYTTCYIATVINLNITELHASTLYWPEDLYLGLLMPFTLEEVRTVQYMIDSYNLSKETFVFSEQNDLLFRRLFQDSESSPDSSKKYDYSSFDVGSLIMTVIKKNVFFVRTIDKVLKLSLNYLDCVERFNSLLQDSNARYSNAMMDNFEVLINNIHFVWLSCPDTDKNGSLYFWTNYIWSLEIPLKLWIEFKLLQYSFYFHLSRQN